MLEGGRSFTGIPSVPLKTYKEGGATATAAGAAMPVLEPKFIPEIPVIVDSGHAPKPRTPERPRVVRFHPDVKSKAEAPPPPIPQRGVEPKPAAKKPAPPPPTENPSAGAAPPAHVSVRGG